MTLLLINGQKYYKLFIHLLQILIKSMELTVNKELNFN